MGTMSERQKKILLKTLSSRKDKGGPGVLRCLVDANSHKLAQKLFYDHISDSNFSKFPLFLQELDQLLHKFGAKTKTREEIAEEDEEVKPDRKSRE
jgi:hypothetical protein